MHLNANVSAEPAASQGSAVKLQLVETPPADRLIATYGERMTTLQVATELGYTETYFLKKIGSAKHTHLDWVKALKPARFSLGLTPYYHTEAVSKFMGQKGILK